MLKMFSYRKMMIKDTGNGSAWGKVRALLVLQRNHRAGRGTSNYMSEMPGGSEVTIIQ
jgi:hypothetical protein